MARRCHSTRPTKPRTFRIANLEFRIWKPGRDSKFAIRHSKFCSAGGRIRTFNQLGLSQSPLPIGSRQHKTECRIANLELRIWQPGAIRNPQFDIRNFCGTGGGIRTLINWFLRPVPLPGWATPVNSRIEDRGLKIEDGRCSSIFDRPSSIRPSSTLDSQRRRQESNLHRNSPGGLARRCHTIRRRLHRLAEGTGLEPASDKCAVVFGTTALPVRLPFRKSSIVSWLGRPDLNRKSRVWNPMVCR